jgi:hypothetical protein
MKLGIKIVGIVLVLLVIWVFWPLIAIWSINTLFPIEIEYNYKTWLATFSLGMLARGSINFNKE